MTRLHRAAIERLKVAAVGGAEERAMFRYLTAGESHGPALVGILDGIPAHLALDVGAINETLARRQGGYGRGARMKIERDEVEFLAGVRGGETLGSPIAAIVRNRDYLTPKVRALMDPLDRARRAADQSAAGPRRLCGRAEVSPARPAQRARARERARDGDARLPRRDLRAVSCGARHPTRSYVSQIGAVEAPELDEWNQDDVEGQRRALPASGDGERMIAAIDAAKAAGDTLGGQFVVRVDGMPVGIGSNRQPNQRLDGILAGAVMGMQTVKAVEIGLGADVAARPGSQAHDVFALDGANVVRASNRAGGIEGGMSNGQPIIVRVSVKPIPTLMKALPSVNLHAGTDAPATIVRSDVCVVPAAAIVGEAMVRLALVGPVLEKYGGDSMEETLDNLRRSRKPRPRCSRAKREEG